MIKKIIKLCSENFLYFCLIANFIVFICLRYCFIIESILKSVLFTLLLFMPTLFSIILLLIKKRKNIKKIIINIIINVIQIVCILLSFIYFCVLIVVGSFIMAVDGVNNIKNYKKVRYQHKISIGPNSIPNNAKNVNFHYNNSFLQGGEVFYLYFKTDNKSLKKYKEEYSIIAKSVIDYNSIDNNYHYLKSMHIDDLFKESKENLKVYYLEGFCDNSGYCNHGEYKIVIIDEFSNSIMFMYEKW